MNESGGCATASRHRRQDEHARRDLISFAAGWGGVTWVVGVIQGQILPGTSHWIVELAHLAAGAIAVVIGLFLARAMTRSQIAMRGRA
jgi:hypothetical protein